MRKLLMTLVVVLAGTNLSGCGYNKLQNQDESVKAAWSEVVNQYQRRADLIPNLVATVKGFAAQEERVLVGVTEARAKATSIQLTPELINNPQAFQQFQQAQGQLTQALKSLLVTVEQVVDERVEILASQVESLGYRALATAHSFASAMPLAPALAVKKALVEYVWEELQRFETASDLYMEIKPGEDLHAVVQPRLADVRGPSTWLEMAIIQFLYDRAGVVQMREMAASGDERVAGLPAPATRSR